MTWRGDVSAREQALHAEDLVASAKSLSAQARALRERSRELAYFTERNRSEADALLANTRQLITNSKKLTEEIRRAGRAIPAVPRPAAINIVHSA